MKKGIIDIIPRTVRTEEREKYVNYLGPIGYQEKNILFLVKKGQEDLINQYEDLKGLTIAVKKKAAYFKRFDEDATLKKQENFDDDDGIAKLFGIGRIDTAAVLDPASLEKALAKKKITNFAYANYKFIQRIGNYYGMSKNSVNASIYPQLNESLLDLAKSGRVTEIYKRYKIKPPLQD